MKRFVFFVIILFCFFGAPAENFPNPKIRILKVLLPFSLSHQQLVKDWGLGKYLSLSGYVCEMVGIKMGDGQHCHI